MKLQILIQNLKFGWIWSQNYNAPNFHKILHSEQIRYATQQTFVLIKLSFIIVFRRCLQDIFKTSWSRWYIGLSHTSSEDILKVSWLRPIYLSWSCVLKTSSIFLVKASWRGLVKTSSRCFKDIFKTSSRCFAKMSSRLLKMYHQVKLFLLTCLQDIFDMYSTRFWDVLQRPLSTERFA